MSRSFAACLSAVLTSVLLPDTARAEVTPLAKIPRLKEHEIGAGELTPSSFIERLTCRNDLRVIRRHEGADPKAACFEWIVPPDVTAFFLEDDSPHSPATGRLVPREPWQSSLPPPVSLVLKAPSAEPSFQRIEFAADPDLKTLLVLKRIPLPVVVLAETRGIRVYGFQEVVSQSGSSTPETYLRFLVETAPVVPAIPKKLEYSPMGDRCGHEGCAPLPEGAIEQVYEQHGRLTSGVIASGGGSTKVRACVPGEKGECATPFVVFASIAKSPKDGATFVSVRIAIRDSLEAAK